ncbi:hypothetical protein FRB94_008287 [Tulasnella sp. JGI-2019a]|nr:hypothetical protein FRB93_006981 [Tulasnella sp. JGI-2019a]KAG9011456.1 hypothetical protein FRB94_008287 [Tulasnella sp. JGI-2019a]
MVNALALLGSLLLASAALAAPSSRLAARLDRRREGRQSKPINRIEPAVQELSRPTNVSHVEYSSNWAGAVYDSAAGSYKAVTATFVVPTPKAASGETSGAASAWVGIDGDTCANAILQTGVDFMVTNGAVSYDAWYEWYPDYAYDFSGITIAAGNSITITVTATSTKAGTAVITNNTTGKTVTKSLTSTYALCEQNAEWIVEDFEEGSSLIPFANFGTVTFTNAYATSPSGTKISPAGATIIDIEQNNVVLTSVTTGANTVTVKYV